MAAIPSVREVNVLSFHIYFVTPRGCASQTSRFTETTFKIQNIADRSENKNKKHFYKKFVCSVCVIIKFRKMVIEQLGSQVHDHHTQRLTINMNFQYTQTPGMYHIFKIN